MKRSYLILVISLFFASTLSASSKFSTAGFFELEKSGREVFNMNPAWRFHKGDVRNAQEISFIDSSWSVVTLPNGIEYLPEEASGCVNYQGIVWYRKHFNVDNSLKGKKLFLHFEAIMGKSKVWINGQLVRESFDGYAPVIASIEQYLNWNGDNIIAVMADNSDDPMYPPGKPQTLLDFTYFGGIYRDCWLVAHNQTYITDPNYENEPGSGGLMVYYPTASDKQAEIAMKLHIRNEQSSNFKGKIRYTLIDKNGVKVKESTSSISVPSKDAKQFAASMNIAKPNLWSPENPYLYDLKIEVLDTKGKIADGYARRIGIRKVEFKGIDGLWLNGKPYHDKLIGVNRHQDFAVIGNALPNSLHYKDAKKLRAAGVRVIRAAHYPHDPAFLDACDEMGIFVIECIAGWQFWNKEPIFGDRILMHIRNMIRRDRNHASVFMWEPVLNETRYPQEFAEKTVECALEEQPYAKDNLACDPHSKGNELFPIIYSHPVSKGSGLSVYSANKLEDNISYFTREWGDNVDDWNSHNSTSRVHRSWGEHAQIVQAQHYANPSYPFTCMEKLYETSPHHIGGTLWHSFDHQRGYHPQPFYGGIMDAYRQPKYSYYMFEAQRPRETNPNIPAESGPMVYIAHEMSPFSPADVTVYSNCEEVRLKVYENGKQYTYKRSDSPLKMPSPIITFKDAFDFMELKKLSRARKQNEVYMLAEGLIDGKVVAIYKMSPSRRPSKLSLRIDNEGIPLRADGSDIVTIIAELTDKDGNVKRLNNNYVKFSVEGEGRLLRQSDIPIRLDWGSAPILLQSTLKAGKIKIHAELENTGINTAEPVEIELESVAVDDRFVYSKTEAEDIDKIITAFGSRLINTGQAGSREEIEKHLKKVEQDQDDFGEKR
ncbi:MAG: glycoside hydrolase family 2 TIM barrel-domain containing protein [Bacteroidales bacterium]